MKSSPSVLALLLLGTLVLSAEAGLLRRTETLTLPAAGIETLIVANGAGLLDCVGEDRKDVVVELTFKVNARSRDKAQQMLDQSSLGVVRDSDELRLKPDLPRGNAWVDILVRLPRGLDLKAGVGSGELRVRDLGGSLELESGSGTIDGRHLGGRVNANLGSGEIELRDVGGSVRVQTGSGDVSILRVESCEVKASSGDVEVHSVRDFCHIETGSGDIEVFKVAGPVELEAGSGDIKASHLHGRLRTKTGSGDQILRGLGVEGQNLDIRSSSGDLELSFLSGASYELKLETSSGEVSARIPMTVRKITRQLLDARVGDGRDTARIETSSGDIRIRATEETP